MPVLSPDGERIAYVTKRGPDPDRHLNWDLYVIDARAGAEEKQVTTLPRRGQRPEPRVAARLEPGRQADRLRAGGEDKWIYYAPWSLAVVDVETGAVTRPLGVDGFHTKPAFTPDGKALLALVEESRVTHLSRIDLRSGAVTPLTTGPRFDYASTRRRTAASRVLGSDDQPSVPHRGGRACGACA